MTDLYNYIVPSISSPLNQGHLLDSELLQAIINRKGEGYHSLFSMEKRDDFKSYQGAARPAFGWFPLDFDSEVLQSAKQDVITLYAALGLSPDYARVFFSGSKGFHLYIRQEFFGSSQEVRTYRDLATKWKSKFAVHSLDVSIIQANRKFRLPNSVHPKTNLCKVELSFSELEQWNIEQIKEYARSPKGISLGTYQAPEPISETTEVSIISNLPADGTVTGSIALPIFGMENALAADTEHTYTERPCVAKLWALENMDIGGRHETMMALIGELYGSGASEDDAIVKITRWAEANNLEPSRMKDIGRLVSEQYSGRRNYSYGCFSEVKKAHCSGLCPLYRGLDKTRRAEVSDLPANPFEPDITAGFHSERMVRGTIVRTPEIEKLKDYFNFISPYVSLRESNITSIWNGTHYTDVSDIEIRMFAHRMFQPAPKTSTTKEFLARVQHTNPRSIDWFKDTTSNLINFKNGVFNTETGLFEEGHSPARGFKYCLPYDYSPTATAPMFSHMLKKVTCGDESLARVVLEFMGYAVSGSECFSDKVLVMFGEGSNGKTRFLNIIRAVMGEAAISLEPNDFEKDAKIRKLDGALLSVTEEMPAFTEKDFWEKIKNLSSGGELTVDIKFKDAVSFSNRCKLSFTCNKLPHGTDPSHGFFRRLILVPFNHEFKQTDSDFTPNIDKLIIESELSGVFNLIWEAFKRLKENNFRFSESKSVNDEIESYKVNIDSVAQWFEETSFLEDSDPNSTLFTPSVNLMQDYLAWAKEREIKSVGFSEFGRRLQRIYPVLKTRHARSVVGGKKVSGFSGVALTDPK